MGKIIPLFNNNSDDELQDKSLDKNIFSNKDVMKYKFLQSIIGTTTLSNSFQSYMGNILDNTYELSKQVEKEKEFYEVYWPKFENSLQNINPASEFNVNHVINNYNSLSYEKQFSVKFDCQQIYLKRDKLLYGEFVDLVDDYIADRENNESNFNKPNNVV